jgi:hypothetical protein
LGGLVMAESTIENESRQNASKKGFVSFVIFIYSIILSLLGIFFVFYPEYNIISSALLISFASFGAVLIFLIQSKVEENLTKSTKLEYKQKIELAFDGIQNEGNALEKYVSQIIKINTQNLTDYYYLVKVQADRSFWASILCAIFGFLIIIASLVYLLINNNSPTSQQINFIATLAGIITEFVSAIFFYLYTQTVRQLKEYHTTLINVQDVLLSIWITQEIENEDKRNQLFLKIIENLSSK